jgi:hypothetical protein
VQCRVRSLPTLYSPAITTWSRGQTKFAGNQLACGFPRVHLQEEAAPRWSRCVPQRCPQRVAGWALPPPAPRARPALVYNRSPTATSRLLRTLLQVLFVHRELDVFKIPPRTGAGGCRSGEWRVSDRIFSGCCRVVAQGDALEVRLEDPTRWVLPA